MSTFICIDDDIHGDLWVCHSQIKYVYMKRCPAGYVVEIGIKIDSRDNASTLIRDNEHTAVGSQEARRILENIVEGRHYWGASDD